MRTAIFLGLYYIGDAIKFSANILNESADVYVFTTFLIMFLFADILEFELKLRKERK